MCRYIAVRRPEEFLLTKYNYSKQILIIIAIGLVVSLGLSFGRFRVEHANKNVDMLYEYEEINSLARQTGKPVAEAMALFKESGVTSLVVYEATLERLVDRGIVNVASGAEILAKSRVGLLMEYTWHNHVSRGQILPDEVYVSSVEKADFEEIEEDMVERFGRGQVRVIREDSPRILAVKGAYKTVMEQHLGLLTSDMQSVVKYGFNVVPRPTNFHAVTRENVQAVFSRLDKVGEKISGILYMGPEVLGYPGEMPLVAAEMNKRGLILGMTEHPLQLQFDKQAGLVDLGKLANYQVARLYVIDKAEQEKKLNVPQAVRRWALTDEERNVRMNFFRSFKEVSPGKTLLETNLEYVSLVRDDVLRRGFTLGPAAAFRVYEPSRFLFIPVIFGAVAAGVLYLSTLTALLSERRQKKLVLLAGAILSLPLLFADVVVIRQAVAFLAAITFPVLAMIWQLENWEKLAEDEDKSLMNIIKQTSWQLAATVFLSLIGGFYVSGILGDIRFMLEMEIYRGVKLTFLMPLVMITLVYMKRYNVFGEALENKSGLIGQLRELLDYPVQLKTLFCLGLGAVVAYIFIGRTGHTAGLPVPGLEIKMRYFLEEVMYARPREKEFLVGHPAFYMAAFAASRNFPHIILYCLVIGATIGQGCLVETFAHMRTPVAMSFIRAMGGLAMGEVLGVMAVLCLSAGVIAGKDLIRRYLGEA